MIKIYGMGWVGKSMLKLFPEALVHDPKAGFFCDIVADVAFVCVPTPLKGRKLDTSIVEEVVRNAGEKLIIIRSTVNPGTCDFLSGEYGKRIVFMPEYLGETVAHPLLDDTRSKFLIIGGKPEDRRQTIELFQRVYNADIKIRQVTLKEAEVIKLSENRAIAWKVAQCQELYDACEASGIDYYTVRDAVYGDDPRFNLWWTFVYPKRGFKSKCLPKDVYAWAAWAESTGIMPVMTRIILEKNKEYLSNEVSYAEAGGKP